MICWERSPIPRELYNQCRVIALPVFVRGGVPLKIVEAFAREKAVVACPELVFGLAIENGQDALIRDRAAFAGGLSTLLADDELCRRLGQNGRKTFLGNWSYAHAEQVLRKSSVLLSRQAEAVRA